MQRAILQQATIKHIQIQATRGLPGHGTGLENQAANDESCQDDSSLFSFVFSVLANVIGGVLLLSLMFVLPHVIARILS